MPGLSGRLRAKSNLDGSADRRFHNNYQIPIALYGGMRFSTVTGLKEAYLASNCDAAAAFSQAYGRVQAAIRTIAGNAAGLDRFTDGAPGVARYFLIWRNFRPYRLSGQHMNIRRLLWRSPPIRRARPD